MECKINEIQAEDHTDDKVEVKIQDKSYYISLDANDANQYISCDLLFATINLHTRAIMLKEVVRKN